MIVRLPKWILVNKFPALYDAESLTAIEQTARLYGKMNELIESYNKYVDDINKTIEEFMTASDKDRETFEVAMRQEFQDFINVIDLKVMELEKYCKDNLTDTVNGLWREMEQQGQVQDLINNTLAEIITTVDEFKALMSKEQSDFETEITSLFKTFKQEVTGGQTEFENTVEGVVGSFNDRVVALETEPKAKMSYNAETKSLTFENIIIEGVE